MRVKVKFLYMFFLALLVFLPANAQDYDQIYQQASDAYDSGRFEQVDSILQNVVTKMKGNVKVRSYRLLALSSLNQDKPELAEEYVSRLLDVDPFFSSYDDSPRFIDMVEEKKKGGVTVSTASKLAESLEEVPVPITLITEDMIKASGANNLSDVLMLYLPGISRISGLENNVAMRGVYGLTQETILLMVDGHRVNSQSTNAAAMDFRHSLDKIKQIEVLRGPASSLYGNVALTAVVNIITKSGIDVDGGKVSARVGSFNSYEGSILFGNGNLQTEYLAWASLYNSEGEKRTEDKFQSLGVPPTTHYIGGYNSKPTYDFGLKFRWNELKVEVMGQSSKSVPYFNLLDVFGNFSYNEYAKLNGEKPGSSNTSIRADVDYSHSWENLTLAASAYAYKEKVSIYNVLGDYVLPEVASALGQAMGISTVVTDGVWQNIFWEDYSAGGTVSGTFRYKMPKGMYGSIVAGVQYECFALSSADIRIGGDYRNINNSFNTIFNIGSEHTLSAYFQLKHNFTKRFILNGGIRYDHKMRVESKRLNTVSPRMSLIWLANDIISVKGGFAHSFVDAPFFYRGVSEGALATILGGGSLEPEQLNSAQFGINFDWKPLHLRYEMNCFYNDVTDMVVYDAGFKNTGKMSIGGIENTIQYSDEKTLANLNCTYQYPFLLRDRNATDDHSFINVPKFLLNFVASRQLFNSRRVGSWWLRANMHYQSGIDYLRNNAIGELVGMETAPLHQDGYAVFGVGAEWKSPFGLGISVDAANVFNTDYLIGGQLIDGVPGNGRSFMAKVSYSF